MLLIGRRAMEPRDERTVLLFPRLQILLCGRLPKVLRARRRRRFRTSQIKLRRAPRFALTAKRSGFRWPTFPLLSSTLRCHPLRVEAEEAPVVEEIPLAMALMALPKNLLLAKLPLPSRPLLVIEDGMSLTLLVPTHYPPLQGVQIAPILLLQMLARPL
jgi:hypothetical protein